MLRLHFLHRFLLRYITTVIEIQGTASLCPCFYTEATNDYATSRSQLSATSSSSPSASTAVGKPSDPLLLSKGKGEICVGDSCDAPPVLCAERCGEFSADGTHSEGGRIGTETRRTTVRFAKGGL
jgi:hypothetical protein